MSAVRFASKSSGRILILQRSAGSEENRATALLALWAAASRGSNTLDILEPSAAASGVSSKIGSLLSMRGITLCRWKFAMTATAVSPFFTKCYSALVNTSSLACCFGGDTPQPHESGFSQSTLLVNAGSR